MSASFVKWSNVEVSRTAITGDGSAITLKNLSNTSGILGDGINNMNGYIFSDWELKCRFTTTPTTPSAAYLWFIRSGTNYSSAISNSRNPARNPDVIFPLTSTSIQQFVSIGEVSMPVGVFKPFLANSGGVAFTNTDDENILTYKTYTFSGVTAD